MAIFTGYKRSLFITVNKLINGVVQLGYPVDYNGAAEFVYDGDTYPLIDSPTLMSMSDVDFNTRLNAFKAYVALEESLLSIDPYIVVGAEARIFDNSTCPNGQELTP